MIVDLSIQYHSYREKSIKREGKTLKLNYKRTFFIGLAFLSISAFWQMYDSLIPLILQNTFHLNETLTGMIMAADNVLAVVLLPLLGAMSDKADTRFGRRTPFIVAGTALAVTFIMLIPAADKSQNLPLFMFSLGAVLLSMGLYRSPAVALMPDLTPKPLRSQANAVINLMGAVGGIYSLLLISFLLKEEEKPDYTILFAGVAILMAAAVVLLVITVREKKLAAQMTQTNALCEAEEESHKDDAPGQTVLEPGVKRSLIFILLSIFFWFTAYNAVTTAFSRYARDVWQIEGGGFANCMMVATVAAIVSYIPIGMVAGRIGRKRSIEIGLLLMMVCFSGAALLPVYHPAVNIGFAMIGIGWAAVGVNSLPMVVEMCSSGDVGKYTGLYYTFSMTAQIVTPVLSGFLMQHLSYRTLFPYATLFTVLALGTMSQVKHGDSRPEAKENILEHFDVDD
jgi:MFS family permease